MHHEKEAGLCRPHCTRGDAAEVVPAPLRAVVGKATCAPLELRPAIGIDLAVKVGEVGRAKRTHCGPQHNPAHAYYARGCQVAPKKHPTCVFWGVGVCMCVRECVLLSSWVRLCACACMPACMRMRVCVCTHTQRERGREGEDRRDGEGEGEGERGRERREGEKRTRAREKERHRETERDRERENAGKGARERTREREKEREKERDREQQTDKVRE